MEALKKSQSLQKIESRSVMSIWAYGVLPLIKQSYAYSL